MGWNLMREVLDHAPHKLTSGELVLLLVLAYHANDVSRECWPGSDTLTAHTRLSASGLRKAAARLAERGLEIRVSVATHRAGNPYTHRAHRTVYRIPKLSNGGTTVPAIGPEWRDHSPGNRAGMPGPQSRNAGTTVPPSQSIQSEISLTRGRAREAAAIAALGANTGETRAVLDRITKDHQPRNLSAYVSRLAQTGDLAAVLDNVRGQTQSANVAALLAELRRKPACEHGEPGGDQLHPNGGKPLCPACRAQDQATARLPKHRRAQ